MDNKMKMKFTISWFPLAWLEGKTSIMFGF